MPIATRPDGYEIDADPARLQVDVVHGFLRTAYWSAGIPRDVVERSIAHSVNFGLYASGGEQAGYARVVTDKATFAWLGDVFVLPEHRGKRLGVWLIEHVVAHPELQGLRRFALATADAHGLYAHWGFTPLDHPEMMVAIERSPTDLYGGRPG